MQKPKLTYDNNELLIKNEAWINLILGLPAIVLLAIAIFFGRVTKPFFQENPTLMIVALIFIIIAIYSLVRHSLDRRLKMVINKEGIWTPKNGLLKWSNIQYYYYEEIVSDNDTTYLLKFKLLRPAKGVKMEISFFDKSEQDIDTAIRSNSAPYNIIAQKNNY